ncbi:MAG: hypothetical protein AAGJ93_00635, partial [Bacteroidota bacterium]
MVFSKYSKTIFYLHIFSWIIITHFSCQYEPKVAVNTTTTIFKRDSSYVADSMQVYELVDSVWVHYRSGNYQEYRKICNQAQALAEKYMSQDSFFLKTHALIEVGIAQTHCLEGHYSIWLPKFEEATQKLAQLVSPNDELHYSHLATSLVGLSLEYKKIGNLEKALESQIESSVISKKLVENSRAPYYYLINGNYNLANIYHKLGQYEQSINLFQICVEQSREIKNTLRLSEYFAAIGNMYLEKGLLSDASVAIDSALKYSHYSDNQNIYQSRPLIQTQVQLKLAREDTTGAISLLEPYIQLKIDSSDQHLVRLAHFCLNQAVDILFYQKKYEQCLNLLERAEQLYPYFSPDSSQERFDAKIKKGLTLIELNKEREASQIAQEILLEYIPDFSIKKHYSSDTIEQWPNHVRLLSSIYLLMKASQHKWLDNKITTYREDVIKYAQIGTHLLYNTAVSYSDDISKANIFRDFEEFYEIQLFHYLGNNSNNFNSSSFSNGFD